MSKINIHLKGSNVPLATNLTLEEVDCQCDSDRCTYTLVHEDLLAAWNKLRIAWGKPLKINSGFRCQTHNQRVGGAKKSRHTLGLALDISLVGYDRYTLLEAARRVFPFVLEYENFMHVDVRKL